MPAPRHIALLSTDFKPMVGGVADYLHHLADAVSASIPVTVLTSAPQNGADWPHAYHLQPLPAVPERRVNESAGDRFAPLRKFRTGAYFLSLREYGRRTISQITSQLGSDTAVVIGIWDMAAHAWCAACRRENVPYYLFAHGAEVLMPLYGQLPGWRDEDFRSANRVIANSTATAQLTVDRLKLDVAPAVVNPSVGPRPDPDAIARRARELRTRLALQPGRAVLSLGRLVPRKGFDLVVRAVASVARECPDLSYVIAGDGPERARLESLARELGVGGRVHFLGGVDDLTKWAAYDVCDVFVMPNRVLDGADWEGFGIVFLEAALSGRPSIAGRTGGAGDAVVHDVTGLLIDPESERELPDALLVLMRDSALRGRLGQAGLARALDRFTPAAAAESLRDQVGWSQAAR
jgi:glycosyltransferase involved in cell wall biosynthesis